MTADELHHLREVLSMTQRELADALGMHVNSIARMERGELAISARTAAAVRLLVSR